MKAFFSNSQRLLFWLAVVAAVLPCVWYGVQNSLNYDVAWLLAAAQRILEGGSVARDAFDVTPPLYLTVLFPPLILSGLTGIPVYYSAFFYTMLLAVLSLLACRALVARWDFMEGGGKDVLCGAFFLALLILPSADFGEKDHLILMGLMPFVLVQISLTRGITFPARLLWPILIAGAILIVTKPHYGLLPSLLLAQRMIVQRRFFSIAKDADFLALAGATLTGLALTGLFFPDYFTVVLPDTLALYVPSRDASLLNTALSYAAFSGIFAMVVCFLPLDRQKRNLFLLLLFASVVNLVPYYVQGKGYWYHLLPSLVFLMTGLGTGLHMVIARYAPKLFPSLLSIFALIAILYGLIPLNTKFPSHQDIKEFPVTKIVQECTRPCTFFMFNSNMGIMHLTAAYSGRAHASRFSAFWFLPGILAGLEHGDPDAIRYRRKYAQMVAEDFSRYKPENVLLGKFPLYGPGREDFDFAAFFSENPAFAKEWSHYEFQRTLTVRRGDYYRGTILDASPDASFDLYRRTDSP